jgi:hypothetical protein
MTANQTNLNWEIKGHFLLNCNCDVFCNCPMSLGRAIPEFSLMENVSHGGELLLIMVLLKAIMARLILVVLMLQYF